MNPSETVISETRKSCRGTWRLRQVLKRVLASSVLVMAAALQASAQTVTTVASFNGSDGQTPGYTWMAQGLDGNFYGSASSGGQNFCGTMFKVTPSGTLTTLHSFDGSDGAFPMQGPVLGRDGNFYGTTPSGGLAGINGYGTVYKMTPQGTLTTLHEFCSLPNCGDGQQPQDAELVQATDGNFYGTTEFGGANAYGTVFRITPSGTLTTLYSFCSQTGCSDGRVPLAGMVQATDGNLYGATNGGGVTNGCGTIFRITLKGVLITLYQFDCSNGAPLQIQENNARSSCSFRLLVQKSFLTQVCDSIQPQFCFFAGAGEYPLRQAVTAPATYFESLS